MLSFNEYLEESRSAPLYHGTDVESLVEILKTNVIKTGFIDKDNHWPSKNGSIVSLTRSFKFAVEWALEKEIRDRIVIIELNKEKLKHIYKILPFNYFGSPLAIEDPVARRPDNLKKYYFGTNVNQYEEAVTKDIKSPLKYMNGVHLTEKALMYLKDKHPHIYSVLVRHELVRIL